MMEITAVAVVLDALCCVGIISVLHRCASARPECPRCLSRDTSELSEAHGFCNDCESVFEIESLDTLAA
jgi:hypothetical protein